MWDVALAKLRYSLWYRPGRRIGLKVQNRSLIWNLAALKREEAASVRFGVLSLFPPGRGEAALHRVAIAGSHVYDAK